MVEDTSKKSGSPGAPGSLVRSKTVICFTVAGRAFRNAQASNGR